MTEREQLKLAAKAAGFEIQGWYGDDLETWADISPSGSSVQRWNPLEDDGDALRLAVKLRMDMGWIGEQIAVNNCCEIGDYDATRRAIVRAAVEIGKVMK